MEASGLEEEEEEDDDVVDLRAFSAIGPIMFIELLELPPQPKIVKGWIMQQRKCSVQSRSCFCVMMQNIELKLSWSHTDAKKVTSYISISKVESNNNSKLIKNRCAYQSEMSVLDY